ncbi:hypothetical protein V2G26_006772 [Clonostachys chloroleuca]
MFFFGGFLSLILLSFPLSQLSVYLNRSLVLFFAFASSFLDHSQFYCTISFPFGDHSVLRMRICKDPLPFAFCRRWGSLSLSTLFGSHDHEDISPHIWHHEAHRGSHFGGSFLF